jgi:hypothetical protein
MHGELGLGIPTGVQLAGLQVVSYVPGHNRMKFAKCAGFLPGV